MEMVGKKFSKLTVLSFSHSDPRGSGRYWNCACECGGIATVNSKSLGYGRTKSCGCLKKISPARTHGMKGTPEYKAWSGMKSRCYKESNPKYRDYGGRGITVCAQWRTSFESFFASIGPKPSAAHSLGRKDNDGDYEPKNCGWETPEQQANNRRSGMTPEARGKLSTALKAHFAANPMSDQTRKKMGDARRIFYADNPRSDVVRANISAGRKRYYRDLAKAV